MPTVYLHAGMHKTGTTAFQQFLLQQEPWLMKHGFHVPKAGRGKTGAHHLLVRALAGLPGPANAADLPSKLTQEIDKAGHRDLIISSETLDTIMRAPELLDRYVQYFQSHGYSVAVIVYIRDTLAVINSSYSQSVKSLRQARSFEAYVAKRLKREQPTPVWKVLKSCPDVRLIANPYNAEVRSRGIVRDIVQELGLDWQGDSPPRANSAPGPMTVYLSRWLRLHIDSSNHRPDLRQLKLAKVAVDEHVGRESVVYNGLTNELAARIESAFNDRNEEFAQELWGKPWIECYPGATGQSYIANDYEIVPPDSAIQDSLQLKQAALAEVWASIWSDETLQQADTWPRAIADAMHAAGVDIESIGLNLKHL